MLVNDVAPVDTGNAFIIDLGTFNNYRGNMSGAELSYQIRHDFPSTTPKYESKKITALHIFRDSVVVIDHHPDNNETRDYSIPWNKKFYEELLKISETQPIYIKCTIPAEVNDIDNREFTVLIPVFFRDGSFVSGGETLKFPWGMPINVNASVGFGNIYMNWYSVNSHIIGTENYHMMAGVNLTINLKSLA